MPAADLLARYNQRPDAQLIIAPQWLSTASVPEVFPGQQLWQLLFDEERFQHPLSRSRHSHRRLGAYHWQWVIEPQQPWRGCFMLSVRELLAAPVEPVPPWRQALSLWLTAPSCSALLSLWLPVNLTLMGGALAWLLTTGQWLLSRIEGDQQRILRVRNGACLPAS